MSLVVWLRNPALHASQKKCGWAGRRKPAGTEWGKQGEVSARSSGQPAPSSAGPGFPHHCACTQHEARKGEHA